MHARAEHGNDSLITTQDRSRSSRGANNAYSNLLGYSERVDLPNCKRWCRPHRD